MAATTRAAAYHLHEALSSSWMICDGVSRLAKYWHQMAAAKTSTLASARACPARR